MSVKQAAEIFIIKTLIAYQSISDPTAYRRDHARLIQICATPYRWMFDPAHQLWRRYVFPWQESFLFFFYKGTSFSFRFWKSDVILIFSFSGQGSFKMWGKFMLEDAVRQKRCLAWPLEPWQVLSTKIMELVPFFPWIICNFQGSNFVFLTMDLAMVNDVHIITKYCLLLTWY